MQLQQNANHILIQLADQNFSDFFNQFEKTHTELKNNSLIVDISTLKNCNKEKISLFLSYSDIHIENGTSFVVVYPNFTIDNYPDTFNIVPTLIEAEDLIEMEDMQRELGF